MTNEQRLRLARNLRLLSMQCVRGTAPVFGKDQYFLDEKPHCVIGHAMARSGLDHHAAVWVAMELNDAMRDLRLAVTDANNGDAQREQLPFPLLALADALEGASKASPRP